MPTRSRTRKQPASCRLHSRRPTSPKRSRSRVTRSRSRRAKSPATPGSPTIRTTPKTYEIPFYRDARRNRIGAVAGGVRDSAGSGRRSSTSSRSTASASSVSNEASPCRSSAISCSKPVWDEKPFEGRHCCATFASTPNRRRSTCPPDRSLCRSISPLRMSSRTCSNRARPDSLLRWGFLDAMLRAEGIARRARRRNASRATCWRRIRRCKAEFEAKLAADPGVCEGSVERGSRSSTNVRRGTRRSASAAIRYCGSMALRSRAFDGR